jgi:hypothetical protein
VTNVVAPRTIIYQTLRRQTWPAGLGPEEAVGRPEKRYDGAEMDAATREKLKGLRNGMLRLHKSLLDSERAWYEREVQRIASTGQYLNLVLNDPWFAYLRELSELIVLVDETLDLKDPEAAPEADGDRLLAQSRTLLTPAEEGSGFRRKYFEAMQRDPAVVLAHSDMMRVFDSLG